MKAAVVTAFDKPPQYSDFPAPVLAENEVIIQVSAVGLHPVVKALASGSHYSTQDMVPFIPGIDGVGTLSDGTRVYFGAARSPYGTMAEQAVAYDYMCMPLPDSIDDTTAAALFNPGLSAWLALSWRAQLTVGDTVLINGATGVAGRLAIQIAKHLGAGKVIATGRNKQALEALRALGADALIELDQPLDTITKALSNAAGNTGINIVIDYLWGVQAEKIIAALTQTATCRTKFIQVGDSAGSTITLAASALRSSALELYGSGIGSAPMEQIIEAVPQFTELAATGNLVINTQQISLASIEQTWVQTPPDGCRFVIVPYYL